jgi:hypothetical protein
VRGDLHHALKAESRVDLAAEGRDPFDHVGRLRLVCEPARERDIAPGEGDVTCRKKAFDRELAPLVERAVLLGCLGVASLLGKPVREQEPKGMVFGRQLKCSPKPRNPVRSHHISVSGVGG